MIESFCWLVAVWRSLFYCAFLYLNKDESLCMLISVAFHNIFDSIIICINWICENFTIGSLIHITIKIVIIFPDRSTLWDKLWKIVTIVWIILVQKFLIWIDRYGAYCKLQCMKGFTLGLRKYVYKNLKVGSVMHITSDYLSDSLF